MRRATRAVWNELLPYSPVFTTGEVVDVTGMAASNVSRDLAKLETDGMVTRIKRGLWAVTRHPDFSPFALVPYLFADGQKAYVSLLTALNLHGMIEQIPRSIQIASTTQRPRLKTPVATFEFHQVQKGLFGGFEPYSRAADFDVAVPEKALFDVIYLSVRKGRRYAYLPEVVLPSEFSRARIEQWISRVTHPPLRVAVVDRLESILATADARSVA